MRVFESGAGGARREVSDRVATVPNMLSLARLLALPFIYVDLVDGRFGRATLLLAVFAATDWFDGYLARRLDQVTRFGTLLDPISDRIFVLIAGIGFVVAGITPLWAVLVVLVRDAVVFAIGALMLARGQQPPAASRTGKAATFGVMAAFAGWLGAAWIGGGADTPQPFVDTLSWVVFVVSAVAYHLAAIGYARAVTARRG